MSEVDRWGEARVAAIYDELTAMAVTLSETPTLEGPNYIPQAIARIVAMQQRVGQITQELSVGLVDAECRYDRVELLLKERVRRAMDRAEFAFARTQAERKGLAEQAVNEEYREEVRAAHRARGEAPPAEVPGLEDELCRLKARRHRLRALKSALSVKARGLSRADGAVRLQERSLAGERAAAGIYPHAPDPIRAVELPRQLRAGHDLLAFDPGDEEEIAS